MFISAIISTGEKQMLGDYVMHSSQVKCGICSTVPYINNILSCGNSPPPYYFMFPYLTHWLALCRRLMFTPFKTVIKSYPKSTLIEYRLNWNWWFTHYLTSTKYLHIRHLTYIAFTLLIATFISIWFPLNFCYIGNLPNHRLHL